MNSSLRSTVIVAHHQPSPEVRLVSRESASRPRCLLLTQPETVTHQSSVSITHQRSSSHLQRFGPYMDEWILERPDAVVLG